MDELKLLPCPHCGKIPKIKRDYAYENCGYGAWCTIQCKPFFLPLHLKVEVGKSTWDRALEYAIKDWNKWCRIEYYLLNVQ